MHREVYVLCIICVHVCINVYMHIGLYNIICVYVYLHVLYTVHTYITGNRAVQDLKYIDI